MILTAQLLHALYRSLGGDNINLPSLGTILLGFLSFMEFLRFSEVINLKCLDIILKETYISIKTDIYRERYWRHLLKLQSFLCPTKLFRKNMEAAKFRESEDKYRQICHRQQGFKLKDFDKPISCTPVSMKHFTSGTRKNRIRQNTV